ncbi:MAG: hypothetical protein SD837_02120 [Candidatus Electrothrix scaldis]|nr:MAG: hypothetical protein SD837_02120 [Candidatus Electrothrix sp. GW3-3]
MSLTYIEDSSIMMLRGYLSCMATLCGQNFSFAVSSFKDSRKIDIFVSELVREWSKGDEYIEPSEYTYGGKEIIDYHTARTAVAEFVFNGQLKNIHSETEAEGTVGGKLLWRLFEYYGLASTSLNPSGIFHPLVHGPVYRLAIRNDEHMRALYLLVEIEDMYVLTSFCEWCVSEEK